MLENLDTVQWDQLNGAYGSALKVPDMLNAVDDAPSIEAFEKAYSELFNEVNHQGTIYEVTATAARFIIQMLETTTDTTRCNYHLTMLGEMLRNSQYYPSTVSLYWREPLPITHHRFALAVYDAIADRSDLLIRLLSDNRGDNRAGSAYVLSFLVDQHEQSLPVLVSCLDQTQDHWLQAVCVWSYAQIAYHNRGYNSESHLEQMQQWAQEGETLHLRYAAAMGYLRFSSVSLAFFANAQRTIPDFLMDILAEGLVTDMWQNVANKDTGHNPLHYIYSEATPYISAFDIITRHRQFDTWIALIQRMVLSPVKAHLYCREMMAVAFPRIMSRNLGEYWDNLRSIDLRKEYTDLIYQHEKQARHYQPDKPMTEGQKLAIDAVVSCDPFWEIPTNLFSFYYGLPDDRDVLRHLVMSSS